MRAVKGKNGVLSLIGSTDARLYRRVESEQFLSAGKLSEQEAHQAEELFKRNLLQKQTRNGIVGYLLYPQKRQL